MVPAQRGGLVAEAHGGKLVFKDVAAGVARNEKPVIVVELVRQLEIEVIKIEAVIADIGVFSQWQKEVGIGSPPRQEEGGTVANQGALRGSVCWRRFPRCRWRQNGGHCRLSS